MKLKDSNGESKGHFSSSSSSLPYFEGIGDSRPVLE